MAPKVVLHPKWAAQLVEFERVQAEIARRSLKAFIHTFWTCVEPVKPLSWNWHLDELCKVLEAVTAGDITKLIVNVPPGTMKTLMISVFWPAWEWATAPHLRYLTASYAQERSLAAADNFRKIVTSDMYKRYYNCEIISDNKTHIQTSAGGFRMSTSVGGVGTGVHADRNIIDDAHSAEQARSDLERGRAIVWHDRTISIRGASRGAANIVVMQRLHEDDLTGHLLQLGGWTHVMFPMEFEPARADPRDHRKVAGELLWPHLFTAKIVDDLKINLAAYGTAGQLQQRPAPEGGGLFKRADAVMVDAALVPKSLMRCRFWDCAATEDGGDWTVGLLMARDGAVVYVEDIVRGRWSAHDVDVKIAETAVKDGKMTRVREEQEPGSAGKAICQARARMLVGWNYEGIPASGDKVERSLNFRAAWERGDVRVVRAPWNEAYFQELEIFPNGKHDDQVDGSSGAFQELTGGAQPARVVKAAWG